MTDDDNKLELTRRKILGAAGAVGAAGAAAGLGTSALYSDTESLVENSITAGTLDMVVDASVPEGGINDEWAGAVGFESYVQESDGEPAMGVDLGDMKPGDWVLLCYEITVTSNPACLGLEVTNTANDDNGLTEPEENEGGDSTGGDGEGELAQNIEVTVYDDLDAGALDGTLSGAESALSNELLGGVNLQDVWSTFDGGGAIATDTRTFDFYLLVELPRDVGNVVQTDSVEWDFVFDAVQSRNNECETPVWEEPGECPECSFDTSATGDGASNLLSVGPDPSAGFPAIDARVRVDTTTGNEGDLTASNFAVCENGCGQTLDSVAFESGGLVDLVVVFDDTGSMGGEIDTLQSEVTSLTNDIEAAGIDARYALVSFNDEAELDQDFTDATTFTSAVNSLSAVGGADIPEDNLDALAVGTGNAAGQDGDGASLSSFRSGAQRVIIDITDAPAQEEGDYTDSNTHPDDATTRFSQSEVETMLNDGNFTFYAVSPPESETGPVSKQTIANNVEDGTWMDIGSADFSVILNDIVGTITEPAYVLSYTTTNTATDGSTRTVDIQITGSGAGTLYEEGSYTAPSS